MDWQAEGLVFWTSVVLAVLGAASVIAAVRSRSGSSLHFQRLFVFCLVGTGGTTMIALSLHNSCWLSCGVSCACLAICGTVDSGRVDVEQMIGL